MSRNHGWSCEQIVIKYKKISNDDLQQRLAEAFDLLVKGKSQQQNQSAFSKGSILLNQQAPKTSQQKKGA